MDKPRRTCRSCQEDRAIEDFYDSNRATCRSCLRQRARERRAADLQSARAEERDRQRRYRERRRQRDDDRMTVLLRLATAYPDALLRIAEGYAEERDLGPDEVFQIESVTSRRRKGEDTEPRRTA